MTGTDVFPEKRQTPRPFFDACVPFEGKAGRGRAFRPWIECLSGFARGLPDEKKRDKIDQEERWLVPELAQTYFGNKLVQGE
jgi:hypothetical protein